MSVDARIREGLTMIEKELPEVDTLEAYENLERDIRRDRRRRQAMIGAAAAAVVVVAATGAIMLNHDEKVEPAKPILPNRVVMYDLYNANGRISYVADDGTRHTIPAKNVDRFALSPDGQQSAYVDDTTPKTGEGRKLWIADADGTNARQVPMPCKGCEPGFGVTWSNDGSRIAYSVFTPGSQPAKLAIWDLTTDGKQVFTMPPGEEARGPRFSPDDKLLLMNLSSEGGDSVATMDLSRGINSLASIGGLYNVLQTPWWSDDGQTIYFTASTSGNGVKDTTGSNDLYAIKADGSSTQQITKARKGERFFGAIPYKNFFLTSRARGDGQWTVGWLTSDGSTFTPMEGPDGKPVLGNGALLQQ